MARPKYGTKEGKIASEKWKQTMLKKYGEDGLRRKMQEIGARGGRNGHTGGFAANRELARVAGAKGGSISRRGEVKEWYDNHKYEIATMKDEGISYKEMAQRLGVTVSKMYRAINTYGE